MEKITSLDQLELHILTLEVQQSKDLLIIKERLDITQFLSSKMEELIGSEESKPNANDFALSIGAGYLVKKLIVGSSENLSRNIIGEVLKVAVSTLVFKNATQIKSKGIQFITNLLTKTRKQNL